MVMLVTIIIKYKGDPQKMKIFVTGVAGQLGHDVMNDLAARGYEGIGTDIAPQYSGADDGTAVIKMPYVSLDITDRDAVEKQLQSLSLTW